MMEQKIKYRGSYGYNEKTKQGYYILFDFINNTSFDRVNLVQTTEEECREAFGEAQRKYYEKYPRFLPKGINITNDVNYNFQVNLLDLNGKAIFIGKYWTVQEAIKAKKKVIALNIE